MKKAIAIIGLTGCMFSTSMAQDFTLSGKIAGTSIPYVYLRYANGKGQMVLDSSAASNGSFSFRGIVDGPVYATLYRNPVSWRSEDPNLYSFFLEPGTLTADIKEEVKNTQLKGSATQADMDKLKKLKKPVEEKWKPFFKALDSVNKIDNFKFQEMKEGLKPYYAEIEKIDFSYIDKHPTAYLSAHLLRGYLRSLNTQKLTAYYNQFPEKIKASAGKTIHEELVRRRLGVEGTMAADFSAPDINGQPLKLSDYRGKYVLIDFWASWCLPCRKGNPHLKKLYAEYKDKGFEIIGISDDDSKPDAWKKAVAQDDIGMWKHVLRGLDWEKLRAGIYNERDISKKYGISSLPTKILIDPNGKVIARYEGGDKDDEKMDEKLKAVFGQ